MRPGDGGVASGAACIEGRAAARVPGAEGGIAVGLVVLRTA